MENRGTVTSGDGTLLAYERRGEGPPLVLVSGALGTRASEAALAGLLAPHFTTYTYDRRGRGDSGDGAGPPVRHAVEREVDDLAAVIATAGGGAAVHGTSSGGALALEAAAAGLPITRLSVYEPPYDTDPAARDGFTERAQRLGRLLADGRRGDALALFLSDTPAAELAGLRASPQWPALEALAHTLPYDHAVLGDSLVPAARLAAVTARVLVIDGGASPAWLRDTARAVAHALPNARHSTLTGQTHAVTPQVLAPSLTAFFTAE
ncbi:alpha/beta fold hydrolase [Streptomyces ficellus]|uniref:Alpha/beta hydrolase n=1 Tax=Streptomyces ficellus TaxID=1977088 RepID=A0A6I6F413_9ACTN|nr:alpha/beta hydrolase [Streptomyces ficellus]QGV78370.1 alpha/beta hydrolase [Streptomyces ficellus]